MKPHLLHGSSKACKGPYVTCPSYISHVPLRVEALPAVLTREWTIITVDSGMNLQILFLTEGFPAVGMRALIRLCAHVHVHV